MKRRGLYTPAWRSPSDSDRKLGVKSSNELGTGNEAGTLLPRRDGKVVPVCVQIENNGLCTDDDNDENEVKTTNVTEINNHVEESRVYPGEFRHPPSPSSSTSSISGNLRGYNDSSLKTSVYNLPTELAGSPTPRTRSESVTEQRCQSFVQGLASEALSAVVRSCRRSVQDNSEDVEQLSSVSAPAVFVVSDVKQLVIFSVDRTARCASALSCVPPVTSHSDQTLNRSDCYQPSTLQCVKRSKSYTIWRHLVKEPHYRSA